MRILSWNINGIRTLPQYHPWNALKTGDAILQELNADIICFQEMKSSRQTLDRAFAICSSHDAFFSFPTGKGKTGYSGVAVYTNKTPIKAEEGLTGIIQQKPPLEPRERVSLSYPSAGDLADILLPDEQSNSSSNLAPLDNEGRSLVLDFGLFVLINVYCPNETSDARLPFKMNFHHTLRERVRILIEEEHREVIVVGDMNICATPNDHCDGHLPSNAMCFHDHPARAWFRDWLHPHGPMSDAVRTFWPDRKGMYTCWNQKISARDSNYGTRVDYILVTNGLLPWMKHGDIQPLLKGSDHCPIYIDLHDEITLHDNTPLSLFDVMKLGEKRDPPNLASKYWDEYSGKQTMLSAFFGKRAQDPTPSPPIESGPSPTPTPVDPSPPLPPPSLPSSTPSSLLKRKESVPSTSSSKSTKKQKTKSGQTKLSTFFASASQSSTTTSSSHSTHEDTKLSSPSTDILEFPPSSPSDQVSSDHQLALQLSSTQSPPRPKPLKHTGSSSSIISKSTWSNILAPLTPPKCLVHGEPAKELTVNKPGLNKGKKFFICSRPVGPGYDRGRSERLREEVNPEYKCSFFKWASDVKKEALKPQVHSESDATVSLTVE